MPDVRDIDKTLSAVRSTMRPQGVFLGIVPAIDAIYYQTLLLLDQACGRDQGTSSGRHLGLRDQVAVEPQPVSLPFFLELRDRFALRPAFLRLLRGQRLDLEVSVGERLQKRLIARRLLRGGDADERDRRRAAGAEDQSHSEEHQDREEKGPEHRPAVAHVEAPLDAELLPEELQWVGKLHLVTP